MNFKGKLLILFIAVVVTFLGFNLIASSFTSLLKAAKEADYETIESYLAKCDTETDRNSLLSRRHNILGFDSNH